MLELIVMVGIPGSGKSTYAYEHYPSYIHISYDIIAKSCFGVKFDPRISQALLDIEEIAIHNNLKLGNSVVVANTNVTRADRYKYLEYAREVEGVKTIAVYIRCTLEEAHARNIGRAALVPRDVLEDFYKRLEPPSVEEGFDEVLER